VGENAYRMRVAVYARKMNLSVPKCRDIKWWLEEGEEFGGKASHTVLRFRRK
jgi:hypothetical protein